MVVNLAGGRRGLGGYLRVDIGLLLGNCADFWVDGWGLIVRWRQYASLAMIRG